MDEILKSYPQRFALRLLKWFCPSSLFEMIEGDLIEQYEADVEKFGEVRAKAKLAWNAINFFRLGIVSMHEVKFMRFAKKADRVNQLNFNRANKLVGWAVFAIALTVYFLTVEETASFWDPSEFIASSYKLQVPHPPGAPMFLLLGRLFSFLSFGDNTKVAYTLNMMSALASAFTVLFLFWSIVLLGRKLIGASQSLLSEEKKWLLLASGIVGSLTYAFSDSFWFSAVEAEVYAMSSFSTAVVVWCILKWDSMEDEAQANGFLILIAYVVGLSIGVHLLNLLALPALALVYYFKKFKSSTWGIVLALVIGGAAVLFVNDFVVLGLPTLAGYFELFFVNSLGLFFGSGAIVFAMLIISLLIYGIRITQLKKYAILNTFLLAFSFILIGYGSYSTVIIRSNFNTPINENAPKDVMSVVSYLKREQYGSWPLLYGPYFTSNPIGAKYGAPRYVKGKDKYEIGERRYSLEYKPGDQTIFPRVWDPKFKDNYKSIIGINADQRPTFTQNIYYFFKHQVGGTMYMRYFMWNFAGRENDEDGADWLRPARWFTEMPVALASNPARNNYLMIPFVLGLIGMFYQFMKDTKSFYVLALLFFMLGIAIVMYLNSPPVEPRERDYIYVGSYYAFACWIGLALLAIADAFQRISKNRKVLMVATSLMVISVPALMLNEGWDDHDRSNRFFSVDSAKNMLNSCDANGILFTGGDNDTFPLWYAQETEGCHTNLRVLVLSYCNTDWYIDQMKQEINQSKPFSFTLGDEAYKQGGPNDYLTFADFKLNSIDAKQYLDLLAKNHPQLRSGDKNIFPSKTMTIDIDEDAVLAKGIIPKGMENLIVSQMQIKFLDDVIEKRDLVFLDLLLTTNWERPIYLNPTSMSELNLDLKPYAVQEGNVFRILPVKNNRSDRDYLVNTEKSFDLMIDKFKYRGLDDSGIYYTSDYAMQVMNHRSNLNSLAEALLDKGETEKASQVLSFSLSKMSDAAVPYDPSSPDTVNLLFKAGQKQKAIDVAKVVADRAKEIASFLITDGDTSSFQFRKNMYLLGAMQRNLYENGEDQLAMKYEEDYAGLIGRLENIDSRSEE